MRGKHRNLIVLPKPHEGEPRKELPNARAAYWERPAFFYEWTPIKCNLDGAERYSDADREASKSFSQLTRHAYGRHREIYFDQNGTCGFMEVWKASRSRVARETFPDQDYETLLQAVSRATTKPRFQVYMVPGLKGDPCPYAIRAIQGHSVDLVAEAQDKINVTSKHFSFSVSLHRVPGS